MKFRVHIKAVSKSQMQRRRKIRKAAFIEFSKLYFDEGRHDDSMFILTLAYAPLPVYIGLKVSTDPLLNPSPMSPSYEGIA